MKAEYVDSGKKTEEGEIRYNRRIKARGRPAEYLLINGKYVKYATKKVAKKVAKTVKAKTVKATKKVAKVAKKVTAPVVDAVVTTVEPVVPVVNETPVNQVTETV